MPVTDGLKANTYLWVVTVAARRLRLTSITYSECDNFAAWVEAKGKARTVYAQEPFDEHNGRGVGGWIESLENTEFTVHLRNGLEKPPKGLSLLAEVVLDGTW